MITYISRFYLENYKCFKGENDFNLLDKDGNIVQWTVILGNNNTGKTSILKALADLEPRILNFKKDKEDGEETRKDCTPLNLFREVNRGSIKPSKNDEKSYIGCDFYYKKTSNVRPHFKGSFDLYKKEVSEHKKNNQPNWGFSPNSMWSGGDFSILENVQIYGYGVTRRATTSGLTEIEESLNAQTIFYPEKSLLNIQDWLLQLDYASKNNQKVAKKNLDKIKELIKGGLFPEISDFKFDSTDNLKNIILFKTVGGWNKLEDLGYGYQTTLSWLIDFSKKMFERYPKSTNPLGEPAIVLIDEIDLHLHPSWQKNVVKFLSDIFPSTQFIVTTHSPLVIQSLEKLNLFVLTKNENTLVIHKSSKITFKGWSVEEILEDVMKLESGTYSETYNNLMSQFDEALDLNDYKKAKSIYDKLDQILHPTSPDRKILKIQMSQINNVQK